MVKPVNLFLWVRQLSATKWMATGWTTWLRSPWNSGIFSATILKTGYEVRLASCQAGKRVRFYMVQNSWRIKITTYPICSTEVTNMRIYCTLVVLLQCFAKSETVLFFVRYFNVPLTSGTASLKNQTGLDCAVHKNRAPRVHFGRVCSFWLILLCLALRPTWNCSILISPYLKENTTFILRKSTG